jgi:hypothetical protein
MGYIQCGYRLSTDWKHIEPDRRREIRLSALRVSGSISEFSEAASQSLGVPEVIEIVGMMIVAEKHNIEAQRVGRLRSVTGPVVYSPPAGSRSVR